MAGSLLVARAFLLLALVVAAGAAEASADAIAPDTTAPAATATDATADATADADATAADPAASAAAVVHADNDWCAHGGADWFSSYVDLTVHGATVRMRQIDPASFSMGSPPGEAGRQADERQHQVTLTKTFLIADSPCTQGFWRAIMGSNPSAHVGDDLPVERVSWADCQAFCARLNAILPDAGARLPTEAEWECTCRGGATRAIPYPESAAPDAVLADFAWYQADAGGATHPVRYLDHNRFGLFDPVGNVGQWCADWYGVYPDGDASDPAGPDHGPGRVVRGGSFHADAADCRPARRAWATPDAAAPDLGFRFCLGEDALDLDRIRPAPKPDWHAIHTVTAPPPAGIPAAWSSAAGRDAHGVWADLTVNGVVQRFRLILPGTFEMGTPVGGWQRQPDETAHLVTLTRAFWLADSDCTQAFWSAVAPTNPSDNYGDPRRPVDSVSWNDCMTFIDHLNAGIAGLNAGMPTEAEWEYACRAGTTTPFPGDDINAIAWYAGNARNESHPVKQKAPNPWGLYDMIGNMNNWCSDCIGDYPDAPVTDPLGPATGWGHRIRGASWSCEAYLCRSAIRNGLDDKSGGLGISLRLCIPTPADFVAPVAPAPPPAPPGAQGIPPGPAPTPAPPPAPAPAHPADF
jgi:formylglycine-generating enzyme required for sulfatase activity